MAIDILVVEDEETLRSVITQVLSEEGHHVTAVDSAEEALERLRRESFPLVLTDIVMGSMSGLELLQEIKVLEPDTVVVLMTSHATLEAATQALRAGAHDFLTKPFELDALAQVANKAAERVELTRTNKELVNEMKRNAQELERLNDSLREMANRDGLTGLFNYRFFMEALDREIARSHRHQRQFSLVYIDVDHFKKFNDQHGHLAGDQVLKGLARIFRECMRSATIAARYGGEEFVLLVPEVGRDGAIKLAESLRNHVEEQSFCGRHEEELGKVTISAGISTFPIDGATCGALLSHADRLLYQAKREGRNRVRAVACETI